VPIKHNLNEDKLKLEKLMEENKELKSKIEEFKQFNILVKAKCCDQCL
jgi:hypothetical protein